MVQIDNKYLPTIEEQIMFITNKISENKKQVLGGKLEVVMAEANGEIRNIKVTEDMIEQIIINIDLLQKELDSLEG